MLIVAVSYDVESLNRRLRALESAGNVVVPASSLQSCMNAIFNPFHILIIGASVPFDDRATIAKECKRVRPTAEIISVEWPGSQHLDLADVVVPAGKVLNFTSNIRVRRSGAPTKFKVRRA